MGRKKEEGRLRKFPREEVVLRKFLSKRATIKKEQKKQAKNGSLGRRRDFDLQEFKIPPSTK